jgi:hypothetical protein
VISCNYLECFWSVKIDESKRTAIPGCKMGTMNGFVFLVWTQNTG